MTGCHAPNITTLNTPVVMHHNLSTVWWIAYYRTRQLLHLQCKRPAARSEVVLPPPPKKTSETHHRRRYITLSTCLPCSICVAVSTPVLGGTNCGVGGLSRNASVCVVLSASGTMSVNSSRYTSVCSNRPYDNLKHYAPLQKLDYCLSPLVVDLDNISAAW